MDSFSQLCSDFTKLSPVEAIALGGSRSSTNHDHSSDYDLYIYCSSIPPIEDRQNIIERHCRYFEINNQYWETEDDCTLNDGIDIDILYRSMKDFENGVANVVEKFIAGNGYTTCFWHNLMSSKILFDPKNKLKKLQERFDVPYPKMLKKKYYFEKL